MYVLYFYVDGSDLDEIEAPAVQCFAEQVMPDDRAVWLVNDREERTSDLGPHDLPAWSLGLNIDVDAVAKPRLEEIVKATAELSRSLGRSVIIGGGSTETGIFEDWFSLSSENEPKVTRALFQHVFGQET